MKPRVLYIASGGINEPLIVSQVIRYLKQLDTVFETCHLITLEREPPADADSIRQSLQTHNIHWHGLSAYPGMRAINLWREIWNGYRTGLKLIRQHRLNLIHARSFIPGNIGRQLAKKTQARFLYDMRGFWAEEKWAKGTIKYRWMKRQAQAMENRLFHSADALISLTVAGKQKLLEDGIQTPIDVIPCCVDTDLFCPPVSQPNLNQAGLNDRSGLRMISVGALGPGYLPQSVMGLYQAACKLNPDSSLTLLTRSKRELIEQAAAKTGCPLDQIRIQSAAPEEVAGYLHQADVGLCMIEPSVAKLASSPTKLAEYLACGLPVIANCQSIGDMHSIVHDHQIGVAVDDQSPAGWESAIKAIQKLLQDPKLSSRCRELAVNKFSVEVGVQSYGNVYRRLMQS